MTESPRFRIYVYGILIILIALSYGLIVSGITLVFGSTIMRSDPFLVAVIIVLLAIVFNPIFEWLQKTVIGKIRWIKPINKQTLNQFTSDLMDAKTSSSVAQVIHQYISKMVNPSQLHVFLFDPIKNSFHSFYIEDQEKTYASSEITFNSGSEFVKILSQKKSPFVFERNAKIPEVIKSELTKVALLGTSIFIPLHGRTQLTGWIALGNHSNGIPYKQKELDLFQELGDQAALIAERVQITANLERRINEMNVLTRVSQGVNITLAFDDMLELIYAQISQIIQVSTFHVVLRSPENNSLSFVFYVDEDERISERENEIIQDGYGLAKEVISGQRPIITDDYDRECRKRGVIPNINNLYAWAGIPLNTGAETIGLISLGSRLPDVSIFPEQVNLLQSIADQTAGAMIKVRLLQESERRTNQLRFLNEITRNLSETLEPDLLLRQILDSAIELLNSESGGIYLINHNSNKLNLEESTGFIYENSNKDINRSISEIRNNVIVEGKGYIINNETKNIAIIDDAQSDKHPNLLKNGLIIPIQLKDNFIGVLEVFNRNDGLPFNKDDQELLSAFASQSAIAYDNALKYTFTDQSLSARVEELSVMQRIDRELNASLDVARAMNITMEWAIRQSNAESGFVGVIEEDYLRVMSAYGYDNVVLPEEVRICEDTPILREVLITGEPQNIILSDVEKFYTQASFMEGAQAQYVVPIKREDAVIGIIFLESSILQPLPEDVLAFLIRLSDHAAIAIANAQLYLEVQAANLAKSEFVSFVSHELKTPMTSIKGFADLLAAGAVGTINDAQNNFLTTIRSNVDRMATLVSDLTDVSRIEAGRMRLEYEVVPVKDIVGEVVRSSNNLLENKEQSLIVELDEQISALWGDRTRLIQILINLVSNAIKYSPPKSQIKICSEQCENIWDSSGSTQVIHTSVKDNGYGISPQDQSKVFEKFFRADDPNIREVSGTGLGLNITKTLVEMQGGKIWFESEPNVGTTFHFTIPIAESI